MQKEKSLTLNSVFYLFYNVLNVVFPFITGIYVAHILLSSEIGQVESARNVAQYFVILAYLGIPTYGLREIAKARVNREELNKVYSELIVINFISTVTFLLIYIIVILAVPIYRNNLVLYLITGIAIALNFFNNSWLFEGLEKFGYIAIRNLIFKVLCFILLILLVKKQGDYLLYAAITVLGTAGNYAMNIISSRKHVTFTLKDLNLKRHIKSIVFLVVVNLAIEIYSLIDITMLTIFCDADNVAYYAYGLKIHKILVQVINTFTIVLVPRISLYFKEKRLNEYNTLLSKTLKVILLISVPTVVGIMFVSNYAITSIYGMTYLSSAYVLKILSPILIVSPVGYLLGSRVMLVNGEEKKMIIPVGIGAAVNVVLNYILIQFFLEEGAAIASMVSECVVMIVYILLSHTKFKLDKFNGFFWKEAIAIIIITVYMFLCTMLRINPLFATVLQVLGTVIIYLFSLILLKEDMVINTIKAVKARMVCRK